MKRALIGYTGFVGSNLDRTEVHYTNKYNSKNFQTMRGQSFDQVVCAGVHAVKWWANQNPNEDWQTIEPLLDVLSTIKTSQFTLVSTVDVYGSPIGVDENTEVQTEGLHPYGTHRWQVEEWVREKFHDPLIIRLPGLFGSGLKKNLIFDLLSNKDTSGFDARSTFQFYDLSRLVTDLEVAQNNDLTSVNLATEPVSVAEIAELLTGQKYDNITAAAPITYDMRSVHAAVWGRQGSYMVPADETMASVAAYAKSIEQ